VIFLLLGRRERPIILLDLPLKISLDAILELPTQRFFREMAAGGRFRGIQKCVELADHIGA